MNLSVPEVAFTRGDEKKAWVYVNMSDLARTIKEHLAVGTGPNILKPRPHKVLVRVDGMLLKGTLVQPDMIIDLWGHVKRVTLKLSDGRVVLLALNVTGKLVPKQAVWSVEYDKPVKVG